MYDGRGPRQSDATAICHGLLEKGGEFNLGGGGVGCLEGFFGGRVCFITPHTKVPHCFSADKEPPVVVLGLKSGCLHHAKTQCWELIQRNAKYKEYEYFSSTPCKSKTIAIIIIWRCLDHLPPCSDFFFICPAGQDVVGVTRLDKEGNQFVYSRTQPIDYHPSDVWSFLYYPQEVRVWEGVGVGDTQVWVI